MIGVIAKNHQKFAVEEFFQLFKVPWEFYEEGKSYDTVIVTDGSVPSPAAKLTIIFSPEATPYDNNKAVDLSSRVSGVLIEHNNLFFPVYGDMVTFHTPDFPFLQIKDKKGSAGYMVSQADHKILRIGYDLFDEIEYLLTSGQPAEYAYIPTLEIHILMLRNWILEAGVLLLEIPPFPNGYNFMACLTHDVDFIGIRNHKFDRSLIGFIVRALFPPYLRDFRSKIAWSKLFRNWKALLSLPGVYLGLFRDFWCDIERYCDIEKEIKSTYFFIPFKDNPGATTEKRPPPYRAGRYDIRDYKILIEDLIKKGHEIALHGIDAWHDSGKGTEELETIRTLSGKDSVGVRMHWLYFSRNSPKALEEAGFLYDSSIGYNETVGFRSGTTQVFRLNGSDNVFELPLHVMDTSLFSSHRMGISEYRALDICKKLINYLRVYGGVFTINWHTRSLCPERNWDDFYIELLRILKAENVWFASARQVVEWFCMRRSVHFEEVTFKDGSVQIKLFENIDKRNTLFPLQVRVHFPPGAATKKQISESQNFMDIPWNGEPLTEIVL